jgi:beta-lactamase class A
LTQSLDQLQTKLQQCAALKNLRTGVFVTDQASGRYVDLNGREAYPAASMIKLPIYAALLAAVDQGKINPDQMLEIKQENVTGGSGWLQWRAVGSKISVRDTADLMIIISDNTATNMLIDLLGGKEACNRQFDEWGLTKTHINNLLGDFEGTNTTSPYDLVYLLARIDRGELISAQSKKWMYQTMQRTKIRTLIPPGLGPGSKIAHKTGDIASMVGDVGIVTAANGQKYFISVQVQRPHNDRRANLLIRGLSKMIYQTFSTPDADGTQIAELPGECSGVLPPSVRGAHHHHRHRRA